MAVLFVIAIQLLFPPLLLAQESNPKSACQFLQSWSLHPQGNPIKTTDGKSFRSGDAFVLYDREEENFEMWYTEFYKPTRELGIAYAQSQDGLTWQPYQNQENDPLVLRPTRGRWDGRGLETVSVLKKDGKYIMLYMGYPGMDRRGNIYRGLGRRKSIGVAFSDDGIHWQKHPDPVLWPEEDWEEPWTKTEFRQGKKSAYQDGGLEETAVVWDEENQEFKVWYSAGANLREKDRTVWKIRIGLAASPDAIHWEKYSANPVFIPDQTDRWDNKIVGHTHVIPDPRSGYHLFYVGGKGTLKTAIGHAFSADGIHWQRDPQNPFVRSRLHAGPDDYLVGGPSAVFKDGKFYIWVMQSSPGKHHFMGDVYNYLYTTPCAD